LEDVDLRHARAPSVIKAVSDTGAAVLGRQRAAITLDRAAVTSATGLGVWLQMSATLDANDSSLTAGRSGAALFNRSAARLRGCEVSRCGVHGVCLRGDATAALAACVLAGNGRRAAYCYERADLRLEGCIVRGTADPGRAAVEGAGGRPGDGARLHVAADCAFSGNAGADVRVRGAVAYCCCADVAVHALAEGGAEPVRCAAADGDAGARAQGDAEAPTSRSPPTPTPTPTPTPPPPALPPPPPTD